jgi:riboflavin kinase/FMN adenylyltransferase
MDIIRGIRNIQPHQRSCVVTLGNFDGVHLGHQALIAKVIEKAKTLNVRSTVITFEPQPNEYFSKPKIAARIMRFREKCVAIREAGIDQLLCLRFDADLAALSAEAFVKTNLVDGLEVKHVIVGDDFRFGHRRLGDIQLLQTLGEKNGFTAAAMPTITTMGQRISSTFIRQLLDKADMSSAKALLGRRFGMSGIVAHGDKRGRVLGFPTANIFLHRKLVPIQGVFAVQVQGLPESPVNGVANVGNRPMLEDNRTILEVNLFDFNRDIYGQHVDVEFLHKLRDEEKYDSFEDLKHQMFIDADQAREILSVIEI